MSRKGCIDTTTQFMPSLRDSGDYAPVSLECVNTIWKVVYPRHRGSVDHLYPMLDEREKRAAGRLYFGDDYRRYVLRHFALREILSRYTGREPGEHAINLNTNGKPYLSDPASRLDFSLAGSGDLALIAISREGPVGVDVQEIDPEWDYLPLARVFLGHDVASFLERLPSSELPRSFCDEWVLREAYVKAIGGTLVAFLENDLTANVALMDRATQHWRVPAASGYSAALCVQSEAIVNEPTVIEWEMESTSNGLGFHREIRRRGPQ